MTQAPSGGGGSCRVVPVPPEEAAELRRELGAPHGSYLLQAEVGGRPVAFLVLDPAGRTVEVFHVSEAGLLPEDRVVDAVRFTATDRGFFQDRYRCSPADEPDADGRLHFMETVTAREPDELVHTTALVSGGAVTVEEHVFRHVDLSARYIATPAPGVFGPFLVRPAY